MYTTDLFLRYTFGQPVKGEVSVKVGNTGSNIKRSTKVTSTGNQLCCIYTFIEILL